MREIASGSVAAQARYHLWAGAPAVSIASPPGAGKTTLITQIAPDLATRGDYRIAVATPNRAQAVMIANRLAMVTGPGVVAMPASRRDHGSKGRLNRPLGLHEDVDFVSSDAAALNAGARIVVATAAKWRWTANTHYTQQSRFDLLVVDEAYQVTWAGLRTIAGVAPQLLLVGDPGQIPPIVEVSTGAWRGRADAPHLPAPDVLAGLYPDDVTVLQLPSTFRCGPQTAHVLQPLYPFGFGSGRPETFIEGDAGRLPEIQVAMLPVSSPYDTTMFDAAADAVRELLGARLVVDGEPGRFIEPGDIAVVVPHVHQGVAISARLGDLSGVVTVGTTELTQGNEWPVVVALDPMNAFTPGTVDHVVDPGRLCVALSRATAHTRWIQGDSVLAHLAGLGDDARAQVGALVRRELAGVSV